jgi:hypothetical protein
MSAASTNEEKINPKIVGPEKRGLGSAARGSVELGVKKLAYKPTMKPGWDEVSSNLGGRCRSARQIGPPEGDVMAGSPKGETGGGIRKIGLSKEAAAGKSPKKRSRSSPDARCRRRRKKNRRAKEPSSRRSVKPSICRTVKPSAVDHQPSIHRAVGQSCRRPLSHRAAKRVSRRAVDH